MESKAGAGGGGRGGGGALTCSPWNKRTAPMGWCCHCPEMGAGTWPRRSMSATASAAPSLGRGFNGGASVPEDPNLGGRGAGPSCPAPAQVHEKK